jgi:hypothetical protein
MSIKVQFWNTTADRPSEFGPYDWLFANEQEIRAPIELELMDEFACDFREFSHSIMLPFDNLLAVRQKNGTWELRELAGRYAYEVYEHWKTVKVE